MDLQASQSQIRGLESKIYFAIFFLFAAALASIMYNTAVNFYEADRAISGQGVSILSTRPYEETPIQLGQTDGSFVNILVLISILALGAGGGLYWKKTKELKIRDLAIKAEIRPDELDRKMDILKWIFFKSSKFQFEIKYPDTWQITHTSEESLEVGNEKNILTVSIIDFQANPTMTFQGWLNRHLDSITKIGGRDVIRWSTGNGMIFSSELSDASEHCIIPHDSKRFAVEIDMNIQDMNAYTDSIKIFGMILSTFKFT